MSETVPAQTCYRHPDREAGVRCQRCDRVICPSCMNTASVGFHCPECTKSGAQKVYRASDLVPTPFVTYGLIAINVLVYALGLIQGESVQARRFGFESLTLDYALFGFFIDQEGEWYRIFTSGFLHGGILHLGMNMYALYLLGQGMERRLGPIRFAIIYLVSLTAGSFGALVVDPNVFTVGASGAIYGLFGLLLINQMSAGVNVLRTGLGTILLLNLFFTLGVPGISIGGHLGGFVGGVLCGALLYRVEPQVQMPKLAVDAAMVVVGVAFFFGALWAAGTWMDPIF